MAHIHTLGEVAPLARPIIHLGATSCYVTDNTDLILMREGLGLHPRPAGRGHRRPGPVRRALEGSALPRLHPFPAGPTHHRRQTGDPVVLRFRARPARNRAPHRPAAIPRGQGHDRHAGQLSWPCSAAITRRFRHSIDWSRRKMGFDEVDPVTGQTYSRKVDSQVVSALAGICESAHKFGTDLRLLAHGQEVDEPFETDQVGSSAMAYKRNPMRAERICSLARFVMGLPAMAAQTAATQWLERTLDDSAARRLYLPQAFLGADAVLRLIAQRRHRTWRSAQPSSSRNVRRRIAIHGDRELA